MARGGRRSGKPGVAYPNRTDLNAQPVRTASGQEYGERTRQEQAQQAVPLPAAAPVPPAQPLLRPTERPNEPVTSGLPLGPGPGPEVLGGADLPELEELRAIYMRFPNEGMRTLIELMETGR